MKQMIKKLAVVLSVVLVCAPMGAMAANKLIVKDAAGTIDKMVVTDTGYIGIGTGTASTAGTAGIALQIFGTTGTSSSVQVRSVGNLPWVASSSPEFQFIRNNDSTINGSNPKANDRLGYLDFGTYVNGTTFRYGAAIGAYASSDTPTTSSFPGFLTFETTKPGDTYPSEKLRITSTGEIGIGVYAPLQKLEVNGGIRMTTLAWRPNPCDVSKRGTMWFSVGGGVGGADTFEVCAKDANGAYAWRKLY